MNILASIIMKRRQDNNSLKRQRWLSLTSSSCLPGTTISQLSVILHSHSVLTNAFPSLCVIVLGLGRNDISPSSSTRNPAQLEASGTKEPGLQHLLLCATPTEQETHKTWRFVNCCFRLTYKVVSFTPAPSHKCMSTTQKCTKLFSTRRSWPSVGKTRGKSNHDSHVASPDLRRNTDQF